MLMTAPRQAVHLKAKLFSGFSDPSRLSILETLQAGSLTVTEIVEATGLSMSNTSNHLRALHDCGLVAREQKGRYVHYQLSDERVSELLDLIDELLVDVARGIYECACCKLPDDG